MEFDAVCADVFKHFAPSPTEEYVMPEESVYGYDRVVKPVTQNHSTPVKAKIKAVPKPRAKTTAATKRTPKTTGASKPSTVKKEAKSPGAKSSVKQTKKASPKGTSKTAARSGVKSTAKTNTKSGAKGGARTKAASKTDKKLVASKATGLKAAGAPRTASKATKGAKATQKATGARAVASGRGTKRKITEGVQRVGAKKTSSPSQRQTKVKAPARAKANVGATRMKQPVHSLVRPNDENSFENVCARSAYSVQPNLADAFIRQHLLHYTPRNRNTARVGRTVSPGRMGNGTKGTTVSAIKPPAAARAQASATTPKRKPAVSRGGATKATQKRQRLNAAASSATKAKKVLSSNTTKTIQKGTKGKAKTAAASTQAQAKSKAKAKPRTKAPAKPRATPKKRTPQVQAQSHAVPFQTGLLPGISNPRKQSNVRAPQAINGLPKMQTYKPESELQFFQA